MEGILSAIFRKLMPSTPIRASDEGTSAMPRPLATMSMMEVSRAA
ncbi:hypothetical protein [Sphingobium sp. EP60837]|nr:hypothetical protein [Sphingobium sp. EP60837]